MRTLQIVGVLAVVLLGRQARTIIGTGGLSKDDAERYGQETIRFALGEC